MLSEHTRSALSKCSRANWIHAGKWWGEDKRQYEGRRSEARPSGWADSDRGEKKGRYPSIKDNDSFASAVCMSVTRRNKRSVWSIPTESFSGAHYATFPRNLVRPCILAGTKPGDTVLDPFGGSGTTGVVALEYGRNAILIDLNPANERLMSDRIAPVKGQGLLTLEHNE